MLLARLLLATIVVALLAGAYWGTKAHAATKPTNGEIRCYASRFKYVAGTWVQLDQHLFQVPCPTASRSRRA